MRRSSAGFSLAEVLVASGIMVAVVSVVFGLLSRASDVMARQPDAVDVQQRLRVGISALQRDLMNAGSGAYLGVVPGALARYVAPVLPYRWGTSPDGAFRDDVVTVVYVPQDPAQAAIAAVQRNPGEDAVVTMRDGEGAHTFEIGMRVMLFEPGGAWASAVVTDAAGLTLRIRTGGEISPALASGAGAVAEVITRTYSLKRDEASASFQLVRFDGVETEMPVVDHVVGLRFRYWLAQPGTPELVEAPEATLTDGPWVPDAAAPVRYDADLLRVRRIGIWLRVEAAPAWLRGTTVRSRAVADEEATFDVSPPNMNLER